MIDPSTRDYHCRRCGGYLLQSTVPLGTPGVVRVTCKDGACSKVNAVKIGEDPAPRPDRASWVAYRKLLSERRRAVGTSF
jgi:hypothetical protein